MGTSERQPRCAPRRTWIPTTIGRAVLFVKRRFARGRIAAGGGKPGELLPRCSGYSHRGAPSTEGCGRADCAAFAHDRSRALCSPAVEAAWLRDAVAAAAAASRWRDHRRTAAPDAAARSAVARATAVAYVARCSGRQWRLLPRAADLAAAAADVAARRRQWRLLPNRLHHSVASRPFSRRRRAHSRVPAGNVRTDTEARVGGAERADGSCGLGGRRRRRRRAGHERACVHGVPHCYG